MQLQARLVHAEAGQRVVEVSAWLKGNCLGQTLGEGSTAEIAEDRAIERLQRRLAGSATTSRETAPPPLPPPLASAPATAAAPASTAPAAMAPSAPATVVSAGVGGIPAESPDTPGPPETPEPPADPEDWSDELAAVELELTRLGWGRDQEATYLQRAFGHPSRSRLVRYADLLAHLGSLRRLAPGSDPATAPTPLRRSDLLQQCDQLLERLGWGAAEGRTCLERNFGLASRQQLSDEQLLRFNMLLEEHLPGAATAVG